MLSISFAYTVFHVFFLCTAFRKQTSLSYKSRATESALASLGRYLKESLVVFIVLYNRPLRGLLIKFLHHRSSLPCTCTCCFFTYYCI